MGKGKANHKQNPFCKVCFDTGKPKSMYTNHYVRDVPGPNGKVVCPTLLTIECRYCKQMGHTNSKCPLLLKKKIPENTTNAIDSTVKKQSKLSSNNSFSVLDIDNIDDSSSSEEELHLVKSIKNQEQQEKYWFDYYKNKKDIESKTGTVLSEATYANMVKKGNIPTSTVSPSQPTKLVIDVEEDDRIHKVEFSGPRTPPGPPPPLNRTKMVYSTRSWAEYSDSDDDY